MGPMLQDPEYDKHTFEGGVEIDCENRVHLCKPACCRLPFALSKQDIQVKTFGLPKAIQHDNGTQFCDTQHPEMGGKLDLVLEHLDVESRHIPIAQPEYNGVIEH